MDFGDILDEWDQLTSKPQGTKKKLKQNARASSKTETPRAAPPVKPAPVHPLTQWLAENEVYDKDQGDDEAEAADSTEQKYRKKLLRKRADAMIDLHGLDKLQSWNKLIAFFENSKKHGLKKLIIIHGKGNHSPGEAVLKDIVKRYIKICPFAGESGHEKPEYGGSGVTWVLLKNDGLDG
ncbi:MAG: Smr/MutS family protein [Spirochaetaceae bacterium]|nr:Smr/MutS family protein [Spirochaetaceae bacterium]